MVSEETRPAAKNLMAVKWTPASIVRRQLKAGRRRATTVHLSTYEALGHLSREADRGANLMREAGLDPNDLRLRLIIDTGTDLLCKFLPGHKEVGKFFAEVSKMAGVRFLGILYEQKDSAAAKGESGIVTWIDPFVIEPEAQKQLLALKAHMQNNCTKWN